VGPRPVEGFVQLGLRNPAVALYEVVALPAGYLEMTVPAAIGMDVRRDVSLPEFIPFGHDPSPRCIPGTGARRAYAFLDAAASVSRPGAAPRPALRVGSPVSSALSPAPLRPRSSPRSRPPNSRSRPAPFGSPRRTAAASSAPAGQACG